MRMRQNRKRRLTFITIGIFNLLGGIEYAVILPTLWLYVHNRFDAEQYFLGLILSAFSFSGLVSSPIMGRITDRFSNTKSMLLFANLWEIAGNLLYFIGYSKWTVLVGRLLAGVGSGVTASILADVAKTTTISERTGIMSLIMACSEFGLIFGPGLNIFLKDLNFYIGPFKVDSYTAPGLFMACLWVIMEILVIFMYYNLRKQDPLEAPPDLENGTKTLIDEDVDKRIDLSGNGTVKVTDSSDLIISAEKAILDTSSNPTCSYHSVQEPSQTTDDDKKVDGHTNYTWSYYYNEYMREEVVVILACVFMGMFMQTAVETMVTPLTEKLLKWGELENSIMYCSAGVEILLVFLCVKFLSKKLHDRTMLLLGFCLELGALSWLIYFLPQAKPGETSENLISLIVAIALDVLGLPLLIVCSISLYSKITKEETQGFSQGLRRIMVGMGTILGPLWAGSLLHLPYVMVGVMLGLMAMGTVMLLLSFPKLKPIPQNEPLEVRDESENENTPLLS